MILHFAYGSNMHRAVMRRHAPSAEPLGIAMLSDHRFVITGDGYASVGRTTARTVHGVLWRLTPRDRVTLDLRAEAFNVLNHANFSRPTGALNSSSFGKVTSTINPTGVFSGVGGDDSPRILQFKTRIVF